MAQGLGRLAKKKASRSKGAAKKHQKTTATIRRKGNKHVAPRRARARMGASEATSVTKAINSKNESMIAAKAVGSGTNFFLKDLSEKGEKIRKKQLQERDKKHLKQQRRTTTGRLEKQLEDTLK